MSVREQQMRMSPPRSLVLALLIVALLLAPLMTQALTICQQYTGADGSCSTWCDFYGPGGHYQGYIRYDWCN